MSIFASIMSAIFHTTPASAAAPAAQSAPVPAAAGGAAAKPMADVDVEAVLTGLAAKNPEKLDWRRSIVDLMKLLDLDSGLGARKQLAQELHYSGDTSDSASMNVWLHRQVMLELADNGGRVPESLKG